MKIKEIIIEGYKEANTEFAMNADSGVVQSTIEKYKQLVNKNQVTGNERNIDWWRKQGWEKFYDFVDNKSQQKTTTSVKRARDSGESVTLEDNYEWLIVVPLNKAASCFYGKGTDWCVAKPYQRDFESYFYGQQRTLIFFY